MQPERTEHGFKWGPADVACGFDDDKKGLVTIIIRTKKYPKGIQIYVTKTGKVRVYSSTCEWLPEKDGAE